MSKPTHIAEREKEQFHISPTGMPKKRRRKAGKMYLQKKWGHVRQSALANNAPGFSSDVLKNVGWSPKAATV